MGGFAGGCQDAGDSRDYRHGPSQDAGARVSPFAYDSYPQGRSSCWFEYLGGCEGRLVKAHLVPKSAIKKELRRPGRGTGYIKAAISDPRCWRWMCGGLGYGNAGHHGAYDAYQIRLHAWPEDFLQFLREYDIEWMADRYATESTRRA
jgi:hypothetical protein